MKKFYTLVSSRKTDEGLEIQLDGKAVKTPHGLSLIAPSQAAADAIITEWSEQQDVIDPESMPLTQILTTAIDRIRERDMITKKLMGYLDTDLLCYRTKEPEELAAKQKQSWDQWLSWFYDHYEVPLDITFGLEALKQHEDAHKRVWNYIEALDDYYFTVLHIICVLKGSIVLALAFVEGDIEPEQAFDVAELEEIYYAQLAGEEEHGADPIQEKRWETIRRDLAAARKFLDLLDAE